MKKNNWHIRFSGQNMTTKSLFNKILYNRGINEEFINNFLFPDETFLHPAHEMKNIEKAANIVFNSKHTLIYADTDTDGCSAAAIMFRWIKLFRSVYYPNEQEDISTFINKGKDHGIQDYFKVPENVDTIIVVDSINDDPKPYIDLLERGYKIVVLDHHLISEQVKNLDNSNFALVSSAWDYPNPHLSGSGVTWKFCRYLDYKINSNFSDLLVDLAACGIVADVCNVSLDSMENRAICNKAFTSPLNPAILQICNKKDLDSNIVAMGIAPLINAANRMDRNDLALSLFIEDNKTNIQNILKDLEKIKKEQKSLVEEITPLLIEQGEAQNTACRYFFIDDTNNNLTGLLATKLCEHFGRPCLVLHDCGDSYKGSMRAKGIEDFSAIINQSGYADCKGHENSAGIMIPKNTFNSFWSFIEENLTGCNFVDGFEVDAEIDRAQITPFFMMELSKINRITGAGFKPVKFCIDNITSFEIKELSKGQHLSVNTADLKLMYWNFKDWDKIDKTSTFAAIGSLQENNFMGKTSNQLIMEDYNFHKKVDLFGSNQKFIPGRICCF